jgi:hypothetical protein
VLFHGVVLMGVVALVVAWPHMGLGPSLHVFDVVLVWVGVGWWVLQICISLCCCSYVCFIVVARSSVMSWYTRKQNLELPFLLLL